MLRGAAVNVALAQAKCQSWELVEDLIFIGNIPTERHPLRHWMAVFGLAEIDGRWVEMIHKADQAIFNPQLNFFSKAEDALRGACGEFKNN